MDLFYSLTSYSDFGILVLRVVLGITFIYHGYFKLNGKMGRFMQFIGYAEVLGGAAILVGFLTQLAALGIAIIMAGAIYKKTQEWHIPFWSKDNTGWEYDLMIIAACVVLIFGGAGAFSLDYRLL